MEQSVITRTVTVAPGRFAPGHLGELTQQQLPFEMVDAALAATGRTQSRLRALPARVVVNRLVAGCLSAEQGYVQVWQRLCAGLDGLAVADPTVSALTHARRRQLDQPATALVAGGQRLGQQAPELEHLHPALAHPGDELVVLVLCPLHPQHVVEEQLVVVGRSQPLEAELRPVDDHLA